MHAEKDFFSFDKTKAAQIYCLISIAIYGRTFDTQKFRYLMNYINVFEVNLEVRLVQMIHIASCQGEDLM